jgi:hypothetical protein
MKELVDTMTNDTPEMRPTIEEVVEKFDRIRGSLSEIKLRSPITRKNGPILFAVFWHAVQLTRTARYIIHQRPAIPVPS